MVKKNFLESPNVHPTKSSPTHIETSQLICNANQLTVSICVYEVLMTSSEWSQSDMKKNVHNYFLSSRGGDKVSRGKNKLKYLFIGANFCIIQGHSTAV